MSVFQLPKHDLWVADKDNELYDIFTYYLAEKVVFIAKVNYFDKGKADVESVEYTYGD